MADGAMPSLPNQDCGRSASPCNSRAIFTKARNGCAARSTATWAGTLASKRGLTRQAPALVAASWSAYLRLSKNVRCIGPASSSEASPLICWPPRDGIDQMRLRQRGDVSQRRRRRLLEEGRLRHSTRRGPAGDRHSERCSAAKLELLHAVELPFGDRDRIVEAQRTERRSPDQADTDRGADHIAVVVLQPRAGSGDWHSATASADYSRAR